jgi:hypothetical protein
MDTSREKVPEGPLSGLLSPKAGTNPTAHQAGYTQPSLGDADQKKASLSQTDSDATNLPVGLPQKRNHQWKLTEIAFLTDNIGKLTNQELADRLRLSKNKVRAYIYQLGLKRERQNHSARAGKKRTWTPEEINYLRDHYHQFDADFIGRKINRTDKAVWEMANKMNLKKSANHGKI